MLKKIYRVYLVDDFMYMGEIKAEDDAHIILKKISGEVIKINRKFIIKILEEKEVKKND